MYMAYSYWDNIKKVNGITHKLFDTLVGQTIIIKDERGEKRYEVVSARVENNMLVPRDSKGDAICLIDGGQENRRWFLKGAEVQLHASATVRIARNDHSDSKVEQA